MADPKDTKGRKSADYGLDAPKVAYSLLKWGLTCLALGIALFVANRTANPQGAASMLSALGSIGVSFLLGYGLMVWSSRIGKMKMRDALLNGITWKGDEKVLDVGCGRGLLLIGAAKRLKTGKATGIDLWLDKDLSNNSASETVANAKAEGVFDKVRIESGDARKLTYPDANFDAIVSGTVIHNIPDKAGRERAIREMLRVLRPGGQLAIFDIFKSGEYVKVLETGGVSRVTVSGWWLLWGIPGRMIHVTK
jgi:arsenite methyltransferase